MTINIGDTVEVIDDNITGKAIQINGSQVTLETNDGFLMKFEKTELIKVFKNSVIKNAIKNVNVARVVKEKNKGQKKALRIQQLRKTNQIQLFEVDLHIQHLVDSTKGMSNFDILNVQLDTAKRQLDFAIKKRMPKLVFIHGVGEGVLKQELHTLLRRYDHIKFYDAPFKTYGYGATEVRLYQSVG